MGSHRAAIMPGSTENNGVSKLQDMKLQDSGRVYDCLCAFHSKKKRPELSTPNLVHIYSTAGSQYALTPKK